MSGQFTSVMMFFSLIAIVFAANNATDGDVHSISSRGPAAVDMMAEKEKVLGAFKIAPSLKHTEKIHGPLSVKIELAGQKAAVGEVFVLRGMIFSKQALEKAEFQWSIPTGVEVVNGQVSGELSDVGPGKPTMVEITLRKLAEGNVQIHLLAGSSNKDMGFGDSAQYNTEIQEMLDAPKAPMQKASAQSATVDADAAPAPKQKQLKIFH